MSFRQQGPNRDADQGAAEYDREDKERDQQSVHGYLHHLHQSRVAQAAETIAGFLASMFRRSCIKPSSRCAATLSVASSTAFSSPPADLVRCASRMSSISSSMSESSASVAALRIRRPRA